jgi:hypothetical protein
MCLLFWRWPDRLQVVLMTARDEAASFRIFSALNSRGMDLAMVDKLKADMLEVGRRINGSVS